MPGSTNMSIRVDPELKSQAESILSQLGMNMTGAVNMFLMQIVRDRAVPLSLSLDPPQYLSKSQTLRADLLQARAERNQGYTGRTAEAVLADIDAIIVEAERRG